MGTQGARRSSPAVTYKRRCPWAKPLVLLTRGARWLKSRLSTMTAQCSAGGTTARRMRRINCLDTHCAFRCYHVRRVLSMLFPGASTWALNRRGSSIAPKPSCTVRCECRLPSKEETHSSRMVATSRSNVGRRVLSESNDRCPPLVDTVERHDTVIGHPTAARRATRPESS